MTTAPISQRRRSGQQQGYGCLVAFFSLFLIVGAVAFYFTFVRPVSGWLAARTWAEIPCTIVDSRVAESSDSDGTTYKVDITFVYALNGGEYRSNRYDFSDVYSSGYDGKRAVVDRYPPSTRTVCYADPEDPGRAVLSRGFSWGYLLGLIPLVFVLVGGGGIAGVLYSRRKASPARAPGIATRPAVSPFGVEIPADAASGPLELKPQASPIVKFVGILLVTLFWNGIVSVFVWQVYQGWRTGSPDGCLTAFMIPFVLVGLGMIFGVFRQLLVLFSPRPYLTLSPGSPATGETAWLQWRLSGRAAGVKRLRITLEGREEATYRRGTDTHTDKNVFASIPVTDTTEPYEMAAGSTSVHLPADTMPSFKGSHNKIIWTLKVVPEIPGWPDSEDDFEILVRPGRTRG